MKQILLICAAVALVGGCVQTINGVKVHRSHGEIPGDANHDGYLDMEERIRRQSFKGYSAELELTKADLEKVDEFGLNDSQLVELPKGLEKLTQLYKLYLNGNKLTNVKGLEKHTKLGWLYINHNQLTDVRGLEKLTQLTGLYLRFNKLTEAPKGLENLTQLTYLDLRNNPRLTKAQIDELQKALPKCKIFSGKIDAEYGVSREKFLQFPLPPK